MYVCMYIKVAYCQFAEKQIKIICRANFFFLIAKVTSERWRVEKMNAVWQSAKQVLEVKSIDYFLCGAAQHWL